ncbi:Hypothetical protein, putative [Bodo saltans]|uniref:Uncharacterized protein n=1 Tax=Bodo saltans TaxID=75058 RepID=A0A0S4J3R8_BODSA|nr:Hypothetical protein, putative [Bodo saltans]|eukprot:CUG73431.1 Hypothetical protein, putative [Bodo saltans]
MKFVASTGSRQILPGSRTRGNRVVHQRNGRGMYASLAKGLSRHRPLHGRHTLHLFGMTIRTRGVTMVRFPPLWGRS